MMLQSAETDILIDGLVLPCRVGVPRPERAKTQMIAMDIVCSLGSIAIDRDEISATLNYAEVVRRIRTHVADHSYKLLETLAANIASLCIGLDPRVIRVTVTLRKLRKIESCDAVGVRRIFTPKES